MPSTPDRWVKSPQPNPQANLRLFCFPYAGGSSQIYREWAPNLPKTVEVCAVELPGRGTRWSDIPFTRIEPLVDAIATALLPHLNKPFAFFGHSMGGLVSFELTRFLHKKHDLQPVKLFISGRRAPHIPRSKPPVHTLSEPDFIEALRHLKGTPEAVLENAELMEIMSPVLRADFAVLETYNYSSEPPLDCSITVFGGLEDEIPYENLEAWREHTIAGFSVQMFPGNHFFIHSAQPLLLQFLARELFRLTSQADLAQRS